MLDRLTGWLPRVLLLLIVWGGTVFLWGTFTAWARHQYIERQRQVSAQYATAADAWFDAQFKALKPLAEDSRLRMGLDLPAGVKSLPVQRTLYEYSYLHDQQDVYVVELTRRKVSKVATAAELTPDVLARLGTLSGHYRVVVGTGQYNGVVLLGRKVRAPLPQQVFVLVPVSLEQMAADAVVPTLVRGLEVGLVMPHTKGWAWWRSNTAGFTFDPALDTAMKRRLDALEKEDEYAIMTPLPGLPQVVLALRGHGLLTKVDLLPHVLVGLWALLMSALILWTPTRGARQRLAAQAAPVLAPLQQAWQPVQGTLAAWSEQLESRLAANLKAQWRAAKLHVPLVDGPGHFASGDFADARARVDAGVAEQNKRRNGKGVSLKVKDGKAAVAARGEPENSNDTPPPRAASQRDAQAGATAAADAAEVSGRQESLEETVARCIREKRIALVYQPIYRTTDEMPVMHEVFARLVTPAGRTLMPGEFLPVAAEQKLTLALDMAVFERVLADHFNKGKAPLTPLALNISSTSLDGVSYLKALLATGPRVLQKIAFEVRSQEMVRDPKALHLLKDMQSHGGHLAVDYFGGGNAMLEASKRMGFDYVKLDCNQFTGSDTAKKELIRLCQHARQLDLAVILEKVGSQSTAGFARRVGAPYLQGYALGVPHPTLSTMGLAPQLTGMAALAKR